MYVLDMQSTTSPDVAVTLVKNDLGSPRAVEVTAEDVKSARLKYDPELLVGFLRRARQLGCPLSRVCWATDYPGFEFPETLLPKLALVNRAAGDDPLVPQADIARMLGGNYARFIGMDWSQDETLEQMRGLEERWTGILTGGATNPPPPRPQHSC